MTTVSLELLDLRDALCITKEISSPVSWRLSPGNGAILRSSRIATRSKSVLEHFSTLIQIVITNAQFFANKVRWLFCKPRFFAD
jgi:hypothetical protein